MLKVFKLSGKRIVTREPWRAL